MKSFKNYLSEGISPAGLHKAAVLIKSYLHRKLEADLFHFPDAEEYKSDENGHGYGIRFFIPSGNRSVRINWTAANSIGLTGVSSADVWLDSKTPYHVKFDAEQSLAQTLPVIADILTGDTKSGHFLTPPSKVDLNESLDMRTASLLIESVHPEEAYDGIVAMIKDNKFKKYGPGSVYDQYRKTGELIFNALVKAFPQYITKKGAGFVWTGKPEDIRELVIGKSKVLSDLGCTGASVSRGSAEEYAVDAKTEKLIERLPFKTQLADLRHLIKMTIGGSSNALFVAGRGGVGKTHTVEEVLHELGLKDGDGYFKNTGTASPAGLYTLLFRYQDGVILFDDSDDALKDQEARNILKAATDTKKIRKLVWNKRGSNVVDPDDDRSDEEILDAGEIPRYFEFTGKVIFISNLNMDKLDPDGAIRTRAYMIDINPTDDEVYEFMEQICDKVPLQSGLSLSNKDRLKVIKILREGKSKQTANLRKLSRGLNMYAAGGANLNDEELIRMISTYAAWTFFIGLAALQFLFY